MRKIHCLIFLLITFVYSPLWGTTNFTTARLKVMASLLSLSGIDTLSSGEHTHFLYKSHPFTIRVNGWGEVEHIGLKLFNTNMKETKLSKVYDFLERHLLEMDLYKGTDQDIRLNLEHVEFETGKPETAFLLDGTETFRISYETYQKYHVEWLKGEKSLLSIRFNMDYQLLTGCDIVELEQNYLKEIRRFHVNNTTSALHISFPKEGEYFIKEEGSFITDVIRNDLYFRKTGNEWKLVSDPSTPSKSIANILLSGWEKGDYNLAFTLDMYGYREEEDTVRLNDWHQLCVQEGCTPYFGIKSKTDSIYTGTLFMVNKHYGFLHMLSVSFPVSTLKEGKGCIMGRLYAYIKLHNVTDSFFNNSNYKKDDGKTIHTNTLPASVNGNGNDQCPTYRHAEERDQ